MTGSAAGTATPVPAARGEEGVTMSDMDNPNDNAATPTPPPAPEAPAPEQQQADAPQRPAEERKPGRVPFRRDRPGQRKPLDAPRPPSLEHEQIYGYGKKIDAF